MSHKPDKLDTEVIRPDSNRWNVVHDTNVRTDRKHYWHVVRNEHILSALQHACGNLADLSYLEVGCGSANVLGYLFENGLRECTGWDINDHALTIAKGRYPDCSFAHRDFLEPIGAARTFNIVGLFDSLEHFEQDLEVLLRVNTLLQPGGILVLTVPAMMSLWSAYDEYYGHFRRYEKSGLLNLLNRANLKVIQSTYIMAPLGLAMFHRTKEILGSDVEMDGRFVRDSNPHWLLNEAAKLTLRTEHFLMGSRDLGFGASLLVTAQKLDN